LFWSAWWLKSSSFNLPVSFGDVPVDIGARENFIRALNIKVVESKKPVAIWIFYKEKVNS